jgi:hypothetical protein
MIQFDFEKRSTKMVVDLLGRLMDEKLDRCRLILRMALEDASENTDAGPYFKMAVGQYFAKQEKLFIEDMNKFWPEDRDSNE